MPLLPPLIDVDQALPQSFFRRLFKDMLRSSPNVPEVGHNRERSLADQLCQVDVSGAWSMSTRRPSGVSAIWDVKVGEQIFGCCQTLAKPINFIDICRRLYIMLSDDDLQIDSRLREYSNKDLALALALQNGVPSDNPLESASNPAPLVAVHDLGSDKRTQVLYDKVVCLVKGQTKVALVKASATGQDHVASLVGAKDDAMARWWHVAELQLDARKVMMVRNFSAVQWRLG